MIDGLDTGINEFNNFGFDLNIAKFVTYHTRISDASYLTHNNTINTSRNTLNSARSNSSNINAPHHIRRSSSLEKRKNSNQSTPKLGKNYSMTCIDKSLTSIPQEIMQKQTILTVLDISRNKFEHFPMEILLINPLRILRMDHNRIKYLPSDIVKLFHLEGISISYNLIQRLPPNLGKLQHLTDLNLESNVIDDFSKEIIGLKNLKTLNLLQNRVTHLPCEFRELTSLNEFYFEWFKYANPPLRQGQKGKDGQHYLKKLKNKLSELHNNNLKGISFQEFVNLFSIHPVNFRCINRQKQTILHLACIYEDINVMKLLIRDYPDLLEAQDEDGVTPLCASLLNDKSKSVYFLLKNGANALTSGNRSGNPIHIAAKRLNIGALKDILKEGEDPNRIDNKGNTPLHYAMMLMVEGYTKASHIMQNLLEHGANPNAKNRENWTPLHIVARKRDSKALKWITSYNFEVKEIHGRDETFNINKRGGGYKWTPLHIAAYSDSPELVTLLGEADADVFKKSTNGYTPKMVIKKSGVTLKLLQKYEKSWIHKNVLFKKDNQQESLTPSNLKNLDSTKEIKNASKNKFGETSFYGRDARDTSYHGTKLNFCAPLMGSGMIFKGRDFEDDSFEICPETETNSVSSAEDAESARDLYNEICENVKVAADNYTTDIPFDQKAKKTEEYSQILVRHPSLKTKNSTNAFQTLELDFEARYKKLKFEHNFNLEVCNTEIGISKDQVISEKTCFCDKVKIVFGLKALYFQIVDHVFGTFYGLGNKEAFPWYILQESVKRAKEHDHFIMHKSAILEIIAYYEIVPQGLISIFLKLNKSSYESQLLKIFICGILSDMKYFPAIDFFENILKTSSESLMTLREAKKTQNYLKRILKVKSVEMKENSHGRKFSKSSNTRVLQPRDPNI